MNRCSFKSREGINIKQFRKHYIEEIQMGVNQHDSPEARLLR